MAARLVLETGETGLLGRTAPAPSMAPKVSQLLVAFGSGGCGDPAPSFWLRSGSCLARGCSEEVPGMCFSVDLAVEDLCAALCLFLRFLLALSLFTSGCTSGACMFSSHPWL